MDSRAFTVDEVRAWLDAVQAELRAVEQKMDPLLAEQRRLEDREALLRDLLKSFEVSTPSGQADDPSVIPPESGAVGQYVSARAVEILREAGEPLHINELHARFLAQGYTVPGAGKPANLIVHLRKAPAIASPQRGVYGLTEDIGPTKTRKTKKRTTTRRRRKG